MVHSTHIGVPNAIMFGSIDLVVPRIKLPIHVRNVALYNGTEMKPISNRQAHLCFAAGCAFLYKTLYLIYYLDMKEVIQNYLENVDKKLIIRQRIFFVIIFILLI